MMAADVDDDGSHEDATSPTNNNIGADTGIADVDVDVNDDTRSHLSAVNDDVNYDVMHGHITTSDNNNDDSVDIAAAAAAAAAVVSTDDDDDDDDDDGHVVLGEQQADDFITSTSASLPPPASFCESIMISCGLRYGTLLAYTCHNCTVITLITLLTVGSVTSVGRCCVWSSEELFYCHSSNRCYSHTHNDALHTFVSSTAPFSSNELW